jgi:Tat protein secretion system quality control protein TatD with DNase activity
VNTGGKSASSKKVDDKKASSTKDTAKTKKDESNAAKAIKNVGRKNFFLETDDADISIKYIYKKASELLGIDEDIIKQQIQSNFETVFKTKL